MKTAAIGGWVLACAALGLSVPVDSANGWALLIGMVAIPPVMLLRMWHQPAPTMSESIREALK